MLLLYCCSKSVAFLRSGCCASWKIAKVAWNTARACTKEKTQRRKDWCDYLVWSIEILCLWFFQKFFLKWKTCFILNNGLYCCFASVLPMLLMLNAAITGGNRFWSLTKELWYCIYYSTLSSVSLASSCATLVITDWARISVDLIIFEISISFGLALKYLTFLFSATLGLLNKA